MQYVTPPEITVQYRHPSGTQMLTLRNGVGYVQGWVAKKYRCCEPTDGIICRTNEVGDLLGECQRCGRFTTRGGVLELEAETRAAPAARSLPDDAGTDEAKPDMPRRKEQ